jgi:erythronate-4-phosphate dehydrogenase
MRILVDEDIPYAREAFGGLGEVTTRAAAEFPAAVRAADALVVRSTRRVDAALLDGTPVRFVGTATAGIDHIDLPYLARREIRFAAAPGCNAESVAQYVATALAVLRRRLGGSFAGRSIGIVGVGQCGTRVARIARALGLEPVLCDPPRARVEGGDFRPLAELAACDIVTLHVPFVRDGVDCTAGLIDAAFLASMAPTAILLNTCRGEVLDERALLARLRAGRLGAAVIDVWRGEPTIDPELHAGVALATSHIAGYSYDGKVQGTAMMHAALCEFAGIAPHWDAAAALASSPRAVPWPGATDDAEDGIAALLIDAYPIEADAARLTALRDQPPAARAAGFRDLRKFYPQRREFGSTQVVLPAGSGKLGARLRQIGFQAM